jgi:hypothetical protein
VKIGPDHPAQVELPSDFRDGCTLHELGTKCFIRSAMERFSGRQRKCVREKKKKKKKERGKEKRKEDSYETLPCVGRRAEQLWRTIANIGLGIR